MSKRTKRSSHRPLTKAELENRAQHLQPENLRYWKARGYPGRPENWQTLLQQLVPVKKK